MKQRLIITDGDPPLREMCSHGVLFDPEAARTMNEDEVRRKFPRLDGRCPIGCGYSGIAYASVEHYIAGDW